MKTRTRVCLGLGPSLEGDYKTLYRFNNKFLLPHRQRLNFLSLLLRGLFATKVSTALVLEHLDSLEVIKPGGGQGNHHQEDAHRVLGHSQGSLVSPPAAEEEVPGQEEDGQRTDGD